MKSKNRIHNDACRVANTYQGDGYLPEEKWKMLRDEIASSTHKFYDDLVHQLKLQVRFQQDLKRNVKKRCPHRQDLMLEQDAAIHALKALLKRFEEEVL